MLEPYLCVVRSRTADWTRYRSVGIAPRLLVGQPCYLGLISDPDQSFASPPTAAPNSVLLCRCWGRAAGA
jgi:hypothetical protein